ncbi:MAG: hypothetical protein ABSB42_23035 [Tepidisphaeraceae bacterium]|jgi:hypothetical protein
MRNSRPNAVTFILSSAAAIIATGQCSSVFAGAQANIPDFYQHQFWSALPANNPANPSEDPIAGWEGNAGAYGGWCWPTAIADALYYWQVQAPYKGLTTKALGAGNENDISTAGSWLGASGKWIPDIVNNGAFKAGGINTYLNYTGLGPSAPAGQAALQDTLFVVVGGDVYQGTADGGVEIVKQAGNPVTAVQWYETQIDKGESTVITVDQTAASKNNGLWWGNYHCLAGAGYNNANQILVADPDSNLGNQAADAGWWNLTPGGAWDQSPAGMNAAIHRVQVNQYTQFNAAASPPLPGNNGGGFNYKTSDVYGTWNVNADGYTIGSSDNLGGGDNGRYAGVVIGKLDAISPRIAAPAAAAPKGGGAVQESIDLTGEDGSQIDQIQIFPVDPLADQQFSYDQSGWTESEVTTDPWGYSHSGGGEDITDSSGSELTPSMLEQATLDTQGADTGFDVFMHDSLTGDWFMQTIGAPDQAAIDLQQQLPEPGALSLLAIGGLTLLRRRTRS